jgi:formate dehydrogenase major subunit
VQIPPTKVLTCEIRPGRRPRGQALTDLVAGYRRRAGLPEANSPEAGSAGSAAPERQAEPSPGGKEP